MGDLISRQAAIDAILAVTGNSSVRELYEHVQEHGLSDMWSGGVNAAIDIIIALPSAQPEKRTEERTETLGSDEVTLDKVIKLAENLKFELKQDTVIKFEMSEKDLCTLLGEVKERGRKEACEFNTDAEKKARDEGRAEIWNMMRRIVLPHSQEENSYPPRRVKEVFGVEHLSDILTQPLTDVMALDMKLMEEIKREREKLHVGDEVEFDSILGSFPVKKGYVVRIIGEAPNTYVEILTKKQGIFTRYAHDVHKTGRISVSLIRLLDTME